MQTAQNQLLQLSTNKISKSFQLYHGQNYQKQFYFLPKHHETLSLMCSCSPKRFPLPPRPPPEHLILEDHILPEHPAKPPTASLVPRPEVRVTGPYGKNFPEIPRNHIIIPGNFRETGKFPGKTPEIFFSIIAKFYDLGNFPEYARKYFLGHHLNYHASKSPGKCPGNVIYPEI